MQLIKKNKSYIVTLGVEFLILVMSFFVYRLANEMMSDVGFSEYNLSRRSVSLFQPLLMIGLGVAVPRYISIFPKRKSFFIGATILLLISAFVLGSIFLGFKDYFASLLFGETAYSDYILPLFMLLLGYCLHAIVFGYLRGKHYVYYPNILQFFNIGLLPILVILSTSNVTSILYINGGFLIFNSLVLFLVIVIKNRIKYTFRVFIEDSKVLLKYGLPRVLGDFSLLLIITAPTYIILSIQNDLLISGDIAYSITLLNIVGAAFGPLGLVLLPEIANYMQLEQHDKIRNRFYLFISVSMTLCIVGYLIYFFFSKEILEILLGSENRPSINDLSLIILQASFGYTLYIVLRSFLDALKVRATNSFNLLITLFVYAVLIGFNYYSNARVEDYLYSFVVSISILGLLTLFQTYRAIAQLKFSSKLSSENENN